jgi:alginate O-acetyltransferase complex protein AlgI
LAQIFFRANSVEDAFAVLRGAIGANGVGLAPYAKPDFSHWLALGPLFAVIWWFPNTQEILGQYSDKGDTEPPGIGAQHKYRWQPTWQWAVVIGGAFFACFVMIKSASRFLYFQF